MRRGLPWVLGLFILLLAFGCRQDGPVVYDRLVIDTFAPPGGLVSDTYLMLYDGSGSLLAENDNGNPDQTTHDGYSRIDYSAGLPAGTYFVRVNNDSGTGSPYYAIRALDYYPGSTFPKVATDNDTGDSDGVVVGGIPTDPVPLSLGEIKSRAIDPVGTDVDWFELILP